jgi:hypothetical protein
MFKLTLAALVSGLALSLASPAVVLAAESAVSKTKGDEPSVTTESKKGLTPKADTRSEKTKAAGSLPKTAGDEPAVTMESKKGLTKKADTRSEKAKAEGSLPKTVGDDAAPSPQPKKK